MDYSKNGLYMVSIVGIVAIVGIVVMIIGQSGQRGNLDIEASEGLNSDSVGFAHGVTRVNTTKPGYNVLRGYLDTDWYNIDKPGGSGDWELATNIPGLCTNPIFAECQVAYDVYGAYGYIEGGHIPAGLDYRPAHQNVSCTKKGLICQNADNPGGCFDYKVRFICPIDRYENYIINTTVSNAYGTAYGAN